MFSKANYAKQVVCCRCSNLHALFQVNQAKPATAGKAVTATEVPLGWPGSLGFLVPPALLALPGTASQRPAGCRRDREQKRTWKGPEWAARVPPCVGSNLHPAQTAEDKITSDGEMQARTNLSTKVSVRYFYHSGCKFFQKEYLATQAGIMVLTEIHRWCLLALSPFGGNKWYLSIFIFDFV